MKLSKTNSGYVSDCGAYLIEKTEHSDKDCKWRVVHHETGASELDGTRKGCVLLAEGHRDKSIEFSN